MFNKPNMLGMLKQAQQAKKQFSFLQRHAVWKLASALTKLYMIDDAIFFFIDFQHTTTARTSALAHAILWIPQWAILHDYYPIYSAQIKLIKSEKVDIMILPLS